MKNNLLVILGILFFVSIHKQEEMEGMEDMENLDENNEDMDDALADTISDIDSGEFVKSLETHLSNV